MQESVGVFVEFNMEFAAESLPAAGTCLSKDLSFNSDEVWTIRCYPRGVASGENDCAGAGAADEYLAVQLLNPAGGAARKKATKVAFEAIALYQPRGKDLPLAMIQHEFDYPETGGEVITMPRLFRTRYLAEHCMVDGYVTVLCGLAVLRHCPIPVPPSTVAYDLRGLAVRSKHGDPDVSFALGSGSDEKLLPLNRNVLTARSPVFKAELDGSMAESTAAVVTAPREFAKATFVALLLYIYTDRLLREGEKVGRLCPGPMSMLELHRELLAAADWYAIDRLKLLCATRLWEYVSAETVSKTFYYADRYNCQELRNACLHYMAKAKNMHQVAVSDEYLWLVKNFPSLIEAIRERIVTQHM